jgi:hypothetical protein
MVLRDVEDSSSTVALAGSFKAVPGTSAKKACNKTSFRCALVRAFLDW